MMRKLRCLMVFLLFLFSSCVEEGGLVYCTLVNESDYNLTIERFGRYDYYNRSIDNPYVLNKGSEITFEYYTDTGMPCYPFCNIDSLVFSYSHTLKKIYTRLDTCKSPLQSEYYEGGKTDYSNHVTTYEFKYRIRNTDFD